MSKPHLEEQTGQAKQWEELSRQHARVPETPHTFKMLRMASMSGRWGEAVGLLGVVGGKDDREMSDVSTGLVVWFCQGGLYSKWSGSHWAV